MSFSESKLMVLTVPSPLISNAVNVDTNFFFHVASEWKIDYGESIYSSNQILGIGEHGNHGGEPLERISWDGFFIMESFLDFDGNGLILTQPNYVIPSPRLQFPEKNGSSNMVVKQILFRGAEDSIDWLNEMKKSGAVARLRLIDRASPGYSDYDGLVQLRSFSVSEVSGEPERRNYSVGFVEYREVEIRQSIGGNINSISKKPDKLGRYTGKYYVTPSDQGIRTISMIAYKKKGGSYVSRLLEANGGTKYLFKLGMKFNKNNKQGPFIIPKHTKLYIPPVKGPIFPVR